MNFMDRPITRRELVEACERAVQGTGGDEDDPGAIALSVLAAGLLRCPHGNDGESCFDCTKIDVLRDPDAARAYAAAELRREAEDVSDAEHVKEWREWHRRTQGHDPVEAQGKGKP